MTREIAGGDTPLRIHAVRTSAPARGSPKARSKVPAPCAALVAEDIRRVTTSSSSAWERDERTDRRPPAKRENGEPAARSSQAVRPRECKATSATIPRNRRRRRDIDEARRARAAGVRTARATDVASSNRGGPSALTRVRTPSLDACARASPRGVAHGTRALGRTSDGPWPRARWPSASPLRRSGCPPPAWRSSFRQRAGRRRATAHGGGCRSRTAGSGAGT